MFSMAGLAATLAVVPKVRAFGTGTALMRRPTIAAIEVVAELRWVKMAIPAFANAGGLGAVFLL